VKAYGPVLDALGDPTRRAIFEHLADRPAAVVELAAVVPVSRPAVSQHLKVLKDAGLVRASAEGTRRVYRVDPDGLRALRDYLDRFWNSALTSFKRRVEQEGAPQ
jgi:DNA-binding transcriptional ArsR family regulator